MNYVLVTSVVPKGAARFGPIKNVPNDHRVKLGRSVIADWPEDAEFRMSDDFPKDVRLTDYLSNTSSLMVVSERFKSLLEGIDGALNGNEILPVKIINHKKREEKGPYFIISQSPQLPCVDEKKTKGQRSNLDPSVFQFVDKLVLDEKLIPKEIVLFRPKQYDRYPIIRRDVAEALQKEKLTGVEFAEIDGYDF